MNVLYCDAPSFSCLQKNLKEIKLKKWLVASNQPHAKNRLLCKHRKVRVTLSACAIVDALLLIEIEKIKGHLSSTFVIFKYFTRSSLYCVQQYILILTIRVALVYILTLINKVKIDKLDAYEIDCVDAFFANFFPSRV